MGPTRVSSKRWQLMVARAPLQVCSWLAAWPWSTCFASLRLADKRLSEASPDLMVCDHLSTTCSGRKDGRRVTMALHLGGKWELGGSGQKGGETTQTACSGLLLGVPSRKSFQESHHDRPQRMPTLSQVYVKGRWRLGHSQLEQEPGLILSPATPALLLWAFKELLADPVGPWRLGAEASGAISRSWGCWRGKVGGIPGPGLCQLS